MGNKTTIETTDSFVFSKASGEKGCTRQSKGEIRERNGKESQNRDGNRSENSTLQDGSTA